MVADIRHAEPGDLVLIVSGGDPAGFARIEAIRPHELDGWFHCDLLLLAVPPRPITWILEREQIDGVEFSMSGQPIRLERLPDLGRAHAAAADSEESAPAGADAEKERAAPAPVAGTTGKVVELFPKHDT